MSFNLEVKISEQVERNSTASLIRISVPICMGFLAN